MFIDIIKKNDRACCIAACDKIETFGTESLKDPYLIGLLIGDGTYGFNKVPRIANCDPEVLNYVKECGYQTKEERKISKHRRRICILFDNMNLNAQGNIFYPLATSFSTEATANNCEVVIEALSNKDESFNLSSYLEDNKFDGTFIVGIN